MVLYLLLIVAANVGLGYAFLVYLNRRVQLLSSSAQRAQEPAVAAADELTLPDARQLKATIDDGLSQITRETSVDVEPPIATPKVSESTEELAAAAQ